MSADLETPFGFAAFLGASTNFKKLFIPATFNMSRMLKSVPRQSSSTVICDQEFYELEVPSAKAAEYQEMCSNVSNVLVAGSSSGSSTLFAKAKASSIDPFTLH